jgi:hypothetical protein
LIAGEAGPNLMGWSDLPACWRDLVLSDQAGAAAGALAKKLYDKYAK